LQYSTTISTDDAASAQGNEQEMWVKFLTLKPGWKKMICEGGKRKGSLALIVPWYEIREDNQEAGREINLHEYLA